MLNRRCWNVIRALLLHVMTFTFGVTLCYILTTNLETDGYSPDRIHEVFEENTLGMENLDFDDTDSPGRSILFKFLCASLNVTFLYFLISYGLNKQVIDNYMAIDSLIWASSNAI